MELKKKKKKKNKYGESERKRVDAMRCAAAGIVICLHRYTVVVGAMRETNNRAQERRRP